jgi:hypothetical protein
MSDADGYTHGEAFMLMTYRADDGTEEEVIWNSRDGVTPFVITLRSGKQATHVSWREDRRVPGYQPAAGERIFVDLTPQRAWELAAARVDAWLASDLADRLLATYGDRETAIEQQAVLPDAGAPDLIVVT